MSQREFFEQEYCERCHSDLMVRTTSWFTTETICGDCSMWEEAIIRAHDESKSALEGCGYIPSVEFTISWGESVPSSLREQ